MQGPVKSDMSSQSWATYESTMDGSHFPDEMSDEVTIEQQRKEELAAMVPPSEDSVASGSSRRTEQWVDETCRERTNEQKRSGLTQIKPTNLQQRKGALAHPWARRRIPVRKQLWTKTSPTRETRIIRDRKCQDPLEGSLEFVPTESIRG